MCRRTAIVPLLAPLLLSGFRPLSAERRTGAGAIVPREPAPATLNRAIVEIDPPAAPGSARPNLASGNGALYLSWLESGGKGERALRISRWMGGWSPARAIVASDSLLANWADFPSVLVLEDGSLAAHWLQKTGKGAHEYDVMVARSKDGGESWRVVGRPHRDGTLNQHGFVSLVDQGGGRFAAVWLDGRQSAHDPARDPFVREEIMLMFAAFENGSFQPETILDPLVCDCCQTAAARVGEGIFVAYRDRSPAEVRDIAYTRFGNGEWAEPRTVHPDGWKIPACPVNGPAVDADGQRLAMVWFTSAGEKSRVQAVFSEDGGHTFGAPVPVDAAKPAGRVDVEWMRDASALVSWIELKGRSNVELRVQQVWPNGGTAPSLVVARSRSARAIGFPRLERHGSDVFLAWTDPGPPSRVRVARLACGSN